MSAPPSTTESAHHLLVPFAAASAPECRALQRTLALPDLSALLAGLSPVATETGDDHDLDAPHERALALTLGLQKPLRPRARALGRLGQRTADPAPGLVHAQPLSGRHGPGHAATRRPAGADGRRSRPLFDALAPFAAEDGIELVYESATRWRAMGEPLRELVVRQPGPREWPLSGRLDPSAQGSHPLITRLQSEAQMLFYTHPVNDRREAARQPIVNGFWVHGAGALTQAVANPLRPEQPDTLRQAALLGDWASWQSAWQALDSGPIAELLARARAGEPVTLTLCGERGWAQWARLPRGLGQRFTRALQSLRGTPPAWKHLDTL